MDKPNRIFFFLHNKKRLKLFKCVREGTEIKSEENQIERERSRLGARLASRLRKVLLGFVEAVFESLGKNSGKREMRENHHLSK